MKLFKNKKMVSITAIVILITVVISAISMTSSTVMAARFPGVDYLINDNSIETPMNILEIVGDVSEASFGFYIKGQEPYGVDAEGNAMTFEEVLLSVQDRVAYVERVRAKLDGKYWHKDLTSVSSETFPLIYETYDERYFFKENDDPTEWKKLSFDSYRYVKINGYYAPVESVEGDEVRYGDYTLKTASFEPVQDGEIGTYVENIAAFEYQGAGNNYNVTFTDQVDQGKTEYGTYCEAFIEVAVVGEEGCPVDGIFWVQNADGTYREVNLDEYQEDVVNGTILYSKKYVLIDGELLENQVPYYVETFEYSNKAEGNYSIRYKSEDEKFIPSDNGTHIRIEDRYAYVPGEGEYDFVMDEESPECDVEVDSFYYKGGFTNNNWFSQHILTLTDENLADNRMNIRVKTKAASEVQTTDFEAVDLIVISYQEGNIFDLPEEIASRLAGMIETSELPCIINSELMVEASPYMFSALQNLVMEDADNNYVKGSVYWHTGDIFSKDLTDNWNITDGTLNGNTAMLGFEAIEEYIELENRYLELENKPLLSLNVNKAVAIQYVLGKQAARANAVKTKLTVLEIQPCAQFVVTPEIVKGITGYTAMSPNDIEIVTMTTAEFVGKIEDLNGTYDFIYIGMATGLMNTNSSGTVYNDSSMNGLIYTHTGDAVIAEGRLAGLLDTDYVFNNRPEYDKVGTGYQVKAGTGYYPYDKEVYKLRTYMDAGILKVQNEDVLFKVNKVNDKSDANGTYEKVTVGNVGVYRYSGNDITEEKMEQLKDYMEAGYPVVLAEGFFDNSTRGSRTVNSRKVDNSSYMYEFANEVINKSNLFVDRDIVNRQSQSESEEFDFYMNIPKLSIDYSEGSLPLDAPLVSDSIEENEGYLQADSDGRYHLSYTFKIKNEAAAQPVDTKYRVSLFIDINSDGKYTRTKENIGDLLVYETNNPTNEVKADELKEGVLYTVTRQLPAGFESVIPWKLEVSQNGNECIRKSLVGYSAIEKSEITEISILQIIPNSGNNWNFATDDEFQSLLNNLGKEGEKLFDISIATKKISEIDTGSNPFGVLNKYDMLILGFDDMYGEITYKATADGILQYIDSGKSVLFTHDTTSFVNTQDRRLDSKERQGLLGLGSDSSSMSANEWGYYLNTEIRDALGMDRYGITSTKTITSGGTIRDELRKGKILNPGLNVTGAEYDKTVVNEIRNAQKDVAYVANSNRAQTYPEVQGYTYATLNLAKKDLGTGNYTGSQFKLIGSNTDVKSKEIEIEADYDGGKEYVIECNTDINAKFELYVGGLSELFGNEARSVDWTEAGREKTAGFHVTVGAGKVILELKSGSIPAGTSFKVYEISSGGTSGTTSTYLNLNSNSGVNSMGSSNSFDGVKVTAVNQGQITNYPYKIPDSFQVANTHAQYYQLDLEADRDMDGESDIVVWYCISDAGSVSNGQVNWAEQDLYSASPNDVRNNYYIYSIGNVFYTGVGHSDVSTGNSTNEKKLFINTMVAAYTSSVVQPEVTALSYENVLAPAATSIAVPVELLTDNDGNLRWHGIDFYYSVFDSNLVSGSLISDNKKVLTARYYIEDANGTEKINGVKVSDITRYVITESKGEHLVPREDGSFIVQSGQAYTCNWVTGQLKNLLDVKESFNLYIKVTSTFTHNGELKELEGTDEILIKKVNLFELD